MLLVGVWAGALAGRALWVLPLSFLAAMLAGFGVGAAGHAATEALITASLLALGLATALRLRTSTVLAAGAVAFFGFAHGMAHGAEAPAAALPLGFAAGFLAASALLHGLGLALTRVVPPSAIRAMGAIGAGLGLVLAVSA